MATIGQHISNIRGLIKVYSRTQENYTDQAIYELLKSARALLIKQVAKQYNYISDWNWETYTIALQVSDPPNWDCVPTYLKKNCKILKSTHKIPQPLKSRNHSLIEVNTLGGQNIDLYTEKEQTVFKDDPIRSKSIMGSIINSYLYIWNNPDLLFAKVSGVWEDPSDWAEIPDCTGTTPTCFDVYTDNFSLDEDLKDAAYDIVLKKLNLPLQMIQDITNNSNEQSKI